MTMMRNIWMLLALCAPMALHAQTVGELRQALALRTASVDSLAAVRVELEREVERLSAVVDGLKQEQSGNRAGGALEKALQQSLIVALALEDCYRKEEILQAEVSAVRERLRDAYDRDIAGLIGALSGAADSVRIAQLQALQQARSGLVQSAPDIGTDSRLPLLAARPDDGPDALRQKAELMADVAARVRREVAQTERRLKQLEVEQRLRGRVETFAAELFLFDETLPEGRSVAVSERGVSGQEPSEPTFGTAEIPEGDRLGDNNRGPDSPSGASGFAVGREPASADSPGLQVRGDGDALTEEIRSLHRQRAVLMAQEKQVSARAKLLHQYLEALLGDAR